MNDWRRDPPETDSPAHISEGVNDAAQPHSENSHPYDRDGNTESYLRTDHEDGFEPALFENIFAPEPILQERIPHVGHVGILGLIAICSLIIASLLSRAAIHFHFLGVTNLQQAQADVRYTLGSEAVLYLISLFMAWVLFPLLWQRSFLSGIHWNGFIAVRSLGKLVSISLLCFLLAMLNGYFMPGPPDTPIDRIFRMPGAAWFLFAFGITMAPFFEELAYRGFLLPAICTAVDWLREKIIGVQPRRADAFGNPDWSLQAMAVGTIFTSVPFALMHAYQTGYSLGPFLLLFVISMVLCAVRLSTRSLAASIVVHAGYNFLLFAFMLIGTSGFKHLGNM
ncbi:MAG: CPBP family intramembrane metalloprotease [Acidobacteriota bacterium]|nr:CPBP family intramembrane metalloprotease [Acidobacteriota bacterium]